MMHFFLKIPADRIATAPFTPVTTGLHILSAEALGLDIAPGGQVIAIPGVSGYIGADTLAAALACGMNDEPEAAGDPGGAPLELLIDIGTNGEIVLRDGCRLYACSAAAGPAFEGANVRDGVGGVAGAIDAVSIREDRICVTTIGNQPVIGICGSGLVDAVAVLLQAGVLEETGRMRDAAELAELPRLSADLRGRLTDADGMRAFSLFSRGGARDILITQKDVRELQNAKAAIAAGIQTLVSRAGKRLTDIRRVYLAGGFGSYLNIESAIAIGLIPAELSGKIVAAGNAAGSGAIEALLSVRALAALRALREKTDYIELSASPDFVNEYVENMMFAAPDCV
jgi:uncharacterized 2Fe-2S/4Fe-4S cluster protein (DUF4445 family)